MCTRHLTSERLRTYSCFQPGSVKFISFCMYSCIPLRALDPSGKGLRTSRLWCAWVHIIFCASSKWNPWIRPLFIFLIIIIHIIMVKWMSIPFLMGWVSNWALTQCISINVILENIKLNLRYDNGIMRRQFSITKAFKMEYFINLEKCISWISHQQYQLKFSFNIVGLWPQSNLKKRDPSLTWRRKKIG